MLNKILRTIKCCWRTFNWFVLTVDRAYFRLSKERQDDIRDFINETWNV